MSTTCYRFYMLWNLWQNFKTIIVIGYIYVRLTILINQPVVYGETISTQPVIWIKINEE
jgi:hypothetical protein